MPDSSIERLGSSYLDDLAIITLSRGLSGGESSNYPDLDEDRRARLRSRLKLISRHDWPASMKEDPRVRRGYTLRQCCRLVVALVLIDSHLPPSLAVAIAKANELGFLRIMVGAMAANSGVNEAKSGRRSADPLALVLLGDLTELVLPEDWSAAEPQQVRFVERASFPNLWSTEFGLAHPGQRLVIDIGGTAASVWRWMVGRRLMTAAALDRLADEIATHADDAGYLAVPGPIRRR